MPNHLPDGTTWSEARQAFKKLSTSDPALGERVSEALEALDAVKGAVGEENFGPQSLALFRLKYDEILAAGFVAEETDPLAQGDNEDERD